MSEPLDLDAIRRRLERALEFVSEAAPDGVRDPEKTRRAAYLLAVTDVPALLAEVERLAGALAEMTGHRDATQVEYDDMRSQRDGYREALRVLGERLEEAGRTLAEVRGTSQQSIDARDRLLHEATAERDRYRDLAERTEQEHRRLEAERADAIRDFVHANDRAGELETELELMRHSRDRYRAAVERVRQVTGKWHQTTNDDPWATIGLVSAAGEILNALSATETSGVDAGTGEARTAGSGDAGPADGAVPAEPRTIDLSRVRGYMWTDPSGTQRMIPPDEIGVLVADSVPAPAKPRVIAWDCRQQLPLDELRAALDAGLVHLYEVDTGSDEFAIVLASVSMEPAAVQAAYEHRDEDYDATKRTWTKSEKCGRCLRPFDPTDTAWNGGARHQDSPWCRSCVDRCHESTDFAHECAVCREATDA